MWPDNQIVLILQTIGPVGKMRLSAFGRSGHGLVHRTCETTAGMLVIEDQFDSRRLCQESVAARRQRDGLHDV